MHPSSSIGPKSRTSSSGADSATSAATQTSHFSLASIRSYASTQLAKVGDSISSLPERKAGSYLVSIGQSVKKDAIVNASLDKMKEALGPSFVNFFISLSKIIQPKLYELTQELLKTHLHIGKEASSCNPLVDVILAKGFANLAQEVNRYGEAYPHLKKLSPLEMTLSFLSVRFNEAATEAHLDQLTACLQKERSSLFSEMWAIFSRELTKEAQREELALELRECIHQKENPLRKAAFHALKKKYSVKAQIPPSNEKDPLKLIGEKLKGLSKTEDEFSKAFQKIAKTFISSFFPRGINDLNNIFSGSVLFKLIPGKQSYFETFISHTAIFLRECYDSTLIEAKVQDKWNMELKRHVAQSNISAVIEASSFALIPVLKNYIYENTASASFLRTFATSSNGSPESTNSEPLVLQPFVHTCLDYVQKALHSNDPHINAMALFFKSRVDHLILGFLAEGAKEILDDKLSQEPTQLIRAVAKHIAQKLKEICREDTPTDKHWKEITDALMKKLPFPLPLKEFIQSLLITMAKEHYISVKEKSDAFASLDIIDMRVEEAIEEYPFGKTLLYLVSLWSHRILKQLPLDFDEITHMFQLKELFEEWRDHYVPQAVIDDDLKEWFMKNMETFKQERENIEATTQRVIAIALKKACLKFLKKSEIDGKINFSQEISYVLSAFSDLFAGESTSKKEDLHKAQLLRVEIENMHIDREEIKKALHAAINDGINERDYQRLSHLLEQLRNAQDAIEALHQQKCHCEKFLDPQLRDTKTIYLALHVQETEMRGLPIPSQKAKVTAEIAILKSQETTCGLEDALKIRLKTLSLLELVLSLDEGTLAKVIELLDCEKALDRAERECQFTKEEIYKETNNTPPKVACAAQKKAALLNLDRKIIKKQEELDLCLSAFHELSSKLIDSLGISKKEDIDLPTSFQLPLWRLLEEAKKKQLVHFLFDQAAPVLTTLYEAEQNGEKVQALAEGNTTGNHLIDAFSEQVGIRSASFFTSHRTVACDILRIMNRVQGNATHRERLVAYKAPEKDIQLVEATLHEFLSQKGRQALTKSACYMIVRELPFSNDEQKRKIVSKLHTLIHLHGDSVTLEMINEALCGMQCRRKDLESTLNHIKRFVLDLGKAAITLEDLYLIGQKAYSQTEMEIYEGEVSSEESTDNSDVDLDSESEFMTDREKILTDLRKEGVLEKIKLAVLSPNEFAEMLISSDLPDFEALRDSIAKEITKMSDSKDPNFEKLSSFLTQFTRSAGLKLIARIGERQHSESTRQKTVLEQITHSLVELAKKSKPLILEDGVIECPEEVAHRLINEILCDILTIPSENDLKTIPPIFRKLVFEKLHTYAYLHLTPVVLPIIERKTLGKTLDQLSGSSFLRLIASAISKDIFIALRPRIQDYNNIAKEILECFEIKKKYDPILIEKMSQELHILSTNGHFKKKDLILAYERATGKNFTKEKNEDLKYKLKKLDIKKKINAILITPTAIIEKIKGISLFKIDDALAEKMAKELSIFLHGEGSKSHCESYNHLTSFIGYYIEGVLLKMFLQVAKMNPPCLVEFERNGILTKRCKDSFVVLTEKSLKIATRQSTLCRSRSMGIGTEFSVSIGEKSVKELLGIDSPDSLQGVPDVLKGTLYDLIIQKFQSIFYDIRKNLTHLEGNNKAIIDVKEKANKYGLERSLKKSFMEILSEDVSQSIVDLTICSFSKEGDKTPSDPSGIMMVSKTMRHFLREMTRKKMQIAKVLLSYFDAGESHFREIVADAMDEVNTSEQFSSQKNVIVSLLANAIIGPIQSLCDRVCAFEKAHKKQMTQELMKGVLHFAAQHLKHLNQAKMIAREDSRGTVLHEDFVAAVDHCAFNAAVDATDPTMALSAQKEALHSAFIKEKVSHQQSLEKVMTILKGKGRTIKASEQKVWQNIESEVLQLIRKIAIDDRNGIKESSIDNFISGIGKIIMSHLGHALSQNTIDALKRPHQGGLDLCDLIREESSSLETQQKDCFYKRLSKSLTSLILPHGTDDLYFLPKEMREGVFTLLKKEGMAQMLPIITETLLSPDMINSVVLSCLDSAKETLEAPIVLSDKDPSDTPDDMDTLIGNLVIEAISLGDSPLWLKKLVTDKKTGHLHNALCRSMGQTLRHKFNDTFIQDHLKIALEAAVTRTHGEPVIKHKVLSDKKRAKEQKEICEQIHVRAKEVVNASFSYFIRSSWKEAQAKFDRMIEKKLGKAGSAIKNALDKVFEFVFFKILGTLLMALIDLLQLKRLLPKIVGIENTMDNLLHLFRNIPKDSPIEGSPYAMMHEDLVFKIGDFVLDLIGKYTELPPSNKTEEAEERAFSDNGSFREPILG